ncbi:nitroreductase, partial [Shewanella sp. SR41-2]|nr:nitroreductase [Shewanella sp. SR41-2]
DANVHQQLGLSKQDQIVGFLYVGTPAVTAPIKPLKNGQQFARYL